MDGQHGIMTRPVDIPLARKFRDSDPRYLHRARTRVSSRGRYRPLPMCFRLNHNRLTRA